MMIKYPIHKVAKDFKRGGKEIPSKEIMEILTNHGHPPKNHMQPLNDEELSIVFDYLTQNNPIDSIESVYADVYHEPKHEPEKAPAKGEKKKEKPTSKSQPDASKAAPAKSEKPKETKEATEAAPSSPAAGSAPKSRVPEKKIVDTRKGGNVNLDKYDERLESFTDQRQQDRGGKQKFHPSG